MKKCSNFLTILFCCAALVLPIFITGCGGGGSVPSTSTNQTAVTTKGSGRVAAAVTLKGRSAGRTAGVATGTVDVTITISGTYSVDGKEFAPVIAKQTIDLSTNPARVTGILVPIGVNHLMVVNANWGTSVETVKAIIPEVAENETEVVEANEYTTVLADTAIYYAAQNNVKLKDITIDQLNTWAQNIGMLMAAGVPAADITPADVIDFVAPVCGDGTQGAGETCDDGNTTDGDGCSSMCQTEAPAAACGDGTLDAGETCDDGNTTSGDGCSSVCQYEIPTTPVCGDGTLDAGEACDDGVNNTNTPCTASYGTSCTYCTTSCTQSTVTAAYCGDGVLDSMDGEACDDGNNTNGDGCSSVCVVEPFCGDGNVDAGETCDDGANNGTPNMCNSSCSGTTSATCGNGTIEAGEACDDAGESISCNTDCTITTCGDSITNATAGETCDDGNAITEYCTYGQTSCTVCDSVCNSTAGATSFCGDGVTDGLNSETCDDGNAVTESCAYGQTSCTVCNSSCANAAGATSYCGDGTIDAGNGEACDTSNLGGASCSSQGYTTGTLACNVSCSFDVSACETCGNGIVEGTEACDAGGNNGQPGSCKNTCDGYVPDLPGKISTDSYNTCIVTSGGGVKCTGDNTQGQLGDGTTTSSTSFVDVSGLTSGVAFVSIADGQFACAITTAGGVKCWGSNSSGKLGDGTTTNSSTPVDVSGLTSGVVSVVTSASHACALTTAGGVKCWGDNALGQLGDGTNTSSTVPVDVTGLTSGVTKIASKDGWVTCALLASGDVQCWGEGTACQLGNGTTFNYNVPVNVVGLPAGGIVDIASGYNYACALTNTGDVKCWGGNGQGRLGAGTQTSMECTPVTAVGLSSSAAAIYIGHSTTCALMTTGGLKCWGDNGYGQIGNGTTTVQPSPVDVTGLTSAVTGVSTGGGAAGSGGPRTCVSYANTLKCWGRNSLGQFGDGTTTQQLTPYDIGTWPWP